MTSQLLLLQTATKLLCDLDVHIERAKDILK